MRQTRQTISRPSADTIMSAYRMHSTCRLTMGKLGEGPFNVQSDQQVEIVTLSSFDSSFTLYEVPATVF